MQVIKVFIIVPILTRKGGFGEDHICQGLQFLTTNFVISAESFSAILTTSENQLFLIKHFWQQAVLYKDDNSVF